MQGQGASSARMDDAGHITAIESGIGARSDEKTQHSRRRRFQRGLKRKPLALIKRLRKAKKVGAMREREIVAAASLVQMAMDGAF